MNLTRVSDMELSREKMIEVCMNAPNGEMYFDGESYLTSDELESFKEQASMAWEQFIELDYSVLDEKPVYTQAMSDNGEIPPVGSSFIVDCRDDDSRTQEFHGKEVEVIGVCNLDGKMVLTFSHYMIGIGCGCYSASWVNPIDTRTKQEKLIDEIIDVTNDLNVEDWAEYLNNNFNITRKGE